MKKTDRELRIGGTYRHFKGNLYRVLDVATHSETGKPMVLYQPLNGDQKKWVRPLAMFLGRTRRNGRYINRFELIET